MNGATAYATDHALSKCPVRAGRDDNGQPAGAQIVANYNWVFTPR